MKNTKRVIAVLLCVIMLGTTLSAGFTSFAADSAYKCNCGVTPVVYIKGRTNIYKDRYAEPTSENMAETNLTGGTEALIESAANILSSFGVALLTDEWDDYCDVLFEEIAPIYDQYKLNNDGEKGEGNKSGIHYLWDVKQIVAGFREVSHIREGHTSNATTFAQYMQFQYDMRLDPRDNADDLNYLIKSVKELTGHDKVNIICRCEGNVIVNAYLHEYGHEDIEGIVMYNSIAMGAEIADEIYSNKVTLDSQAMNRFIDSFIDTSPVLDFVKATVNLATYNGLLDTGLDFVTNIYDKISANLMPRLIREIFGTCPGWWGMVSAEAYEQAKAFVLESDNADGKYNKLIEKLDAYNEMKKTAADVLKAAQEDGVKVYILAKYGDQMYPCIESYDALGDGVVSLYKQSFAGATTSKITDKLSDSYIAERTQQGFGKYISADKKVDGSTAAFADYTWYIKELPHHDYPWCTDVMMLDLLNYNGYATVEDMQDKYTRFMYYKETRGLIGDSDNQLIGELTPLTEENKEETKFTTDTSSLFAVLFKWIKTLIGFIASLFNF